MQTLSADCGSRLRDLAWEFRSAARSGGWEAERLRKYANLLDQIAQQFVREEEELDASW